MLYSGSQGFRSYAGALQANTLKTKHMLMSRHYNAGQQHNIKLTNRCFENVEKFKNLGTIITNQSWIHREIKSSLNK
jgi:L-lysine 2,3-aminomutase